VMPHHLLDRPRSLEAIIIGSCPCRTSWAP